MDLFCQIDEIMNKNHFFFANLDLSGTYDFNIIFVGRFVEFSLIIFCEIELFRRNYPV